MITPEIRQELRAIQAELRKPFLPELHQIRELPGNGYWAFVPHQAVREKLDEVCPEWECEFTSIEQLGADVNCRCTISILGVKKQAIGSVPLVAAERNGKDVSRGSAADRVQAEALKNAAEAWGVGRYLDDQGAVAMYLNENAHRLDNETRTKLKSLANYLRGKGQLPGINSSVAPPKVTDSKQLTNDNVINEQQAKKLYAIAKGKNLTDDEIIAACKKIANVRTTKFVPKDKYQALLNYFESLGDAPQAVTVPLISSVDRDMLSQEIWSLLKRKFPSQEVAKEQGKALSMQRYGVESSKDLSDEQLINFRDFLALMPSQVEPQTV